jgi:hypothetical protein
VEEGEVDARERNDRPGEEALRGALRRWRDWREEGQTVDGVALAPRCVHGVLVKDAVDDLREEMARVRGELEWVRRVIVAGIVSAALTTLLRWAGM